MERCETESGEKDKQESSSPISTATQARTGNITKFEDADHDSLDETFFHGKQQQPSLTRHPIKFTSANFDNSESEDEEGVRLRSESVSKSPSDLSKVASRTVFFHSVTCSAGEKKIVTRKFAFLKTFRSVTLSLMYSIVLLKNLRINLTPIIFSLLFCWNVNWEVSSYVWYVRQTRNRFFSEQLVQTMLLFPCLQLIF